MRTWLRRTTAQNPVITTATAAAWCSAAIASVDGTVNAQDVELVGQLVAQVTDTLEQKLGLALQKSTHRVTWDLDDLLDKDGVLPGILHLDRRIGPIVPVLSVESVTLIDEDGVETALAAADYTLLRSHLDARLLFSDDSWPVDLREHACLVVDLTAGFGPIAATLTLAAVLAGQTVTINGLTFTAHATVTTKASRQFSISGDDTADAVELAACINDPTYGVPGITASASGAVVTLTIAAASVGTVALAATASATTIVVAITDTNVPGLLTLSLKELVTYWYRNPGSGLVINPESGAMRDAPTHPGTVFARLRSAGWGRPLGIA